MAKFNVGDKVRTTSRSDGFDNQSELPRGTEFVIAQVYQEPGFDSIWYRHTANRPIGVKAEHLELVTSDTSEEKKVVKFILQYELDEDPFETFSSMKEVEARILQLSERSDLKRESIRVYEVSSIYEATIHTRILFGNKISLKETKVEKTESVKTRRPYKTKKRVSAELEAARKAYKREYMKKWHAKNKAKKQ